MWLLQAFPYFYVPYGNDLPTEPAEGEEQVPGAAGNPPLSRCRSPPPPPPPFTHNPALHVLHPERFANTALKECHAVFSVCCVVSCPAVGAYLRRLALAIDTALNMSGGLAATAAAATAAVGSGTVAAAVQTDTGGAAAAAAGSDRQQGRFARNKKQHVADLLLVKARPVYGYYADELLFIKVVL